MLVIRKGSISRLFQADSKERITVQLFASPLTNAQENQLSHALETVKGCWTSNTSDYKSF